VNGVHDSVEDLARGLAGAGYVADRALATVVFLARRLEKPLFLEGEPGVGKTEVALVLARLLEARLVRLQCYEGLDVSTSLYEWNYPKQLLAIRLLEQEKRERREMERVLYSPEFLIRRPLLEAITGEDSRACVLLIDEIDRADEEFEAFLLEVLGDFQVTVPELGTLRAKERPTVIITSNRTRDVHDALKRRCLYHWIDYPSFEKEYQIVLSHLPGIEERLARRITAFVQDLRREEFMKRPGVSETLDWARALMTLHREHLDEEVVMETLGCLLKYQEDMERFKGRIWGDEGRRRKLLEGEGT